MLGEFTWEDEADGGLYFSRGHGLALVVLDEASGFAGDAVEGVTDEGVEDGHGPLGDAGVRVDLLQDAVDVDVVQKVCEPGLYRRGLRENRAKKNLLFF